jgi:phosphoglycolate phosphatase-like HAD superfamily hydrolase
VLTNKPLHHSERLLAGLGVRELFDEVVGGDNPYGRKPDPRALIELMAAIGIAGDATLMVGDSLVDWETAKGAGARSCLVAFGFGYARIPKDRLAGDEWVVESGAELAARLRAFVAA